MSKYIVSDTEGEHGIAHIERDTRDEAATEYVHINLLPHMEVANVAEIELAVVLESDVRFYTIEPGFLVHGYKLRIS